MRFHDGAGHIDGYDPVCEACQTPEAATERRRWRDAQQLCKARRLSGVCTMDWDDLPIAGKQAYYNEVVDNEALVVAVDAPEAATDRRSTTDEEHAVEMKLANHHIRRLKRDLKLTNKMNATQGRTIYDLRCQLAAAREVNSKLHRDELKRLERRVAELTRMLGGVAGGAGGNQMQRRTVSTTTGPVAGMHTLSSSS